MNLLGDMMVDNFMDQFDPHDKKFRVAFWNWFDNIPRAEKRKFWNYPVDMSFIYYYNKYYRFNSISAGSSTVRACRS